MQTFSFTQIKIDFIILFHKEIHPFAQTIKMSSCSFCNIKNTIPHTRLECPRRRSLFCTICSIYGHCVKSCPDKIALAVRAGKSTKGITNLEVRIQDSDAAIVEFLKAHNFKPTKKHADNQKLLRDVVNSMEPPRLLVFLPAVS